jgi:HD-GYP domain-containing protein (c-di-GMP phosphodiesterase class II)
MFRVTSTITNEYGVNFNQNKPMNLLSNVDNLEIIHGILKKDSLYVIYPSECDKGIHSVYILSGRIQNSHTKDIYSDGDYFQGRNLIKEVHMDVIEDTKVIIISQQPLFNHQLDYLERYNERMLIIQDKDHYTQEHCNRTGNLCSKIAIRMNISGERLTNFIYISKIHDIGKIFIPDEILNKPGKLTKDEFEIIKTHSLKGYELVVDEMGERSSRILLEHHEKIDGSGYPDGKLGNQMLLESKILAVVDAFDALSSKRPYRDALSEEKAIEILKRDAGILWDNEVVDLLVDIVNE